MRVRNPGFVPTPTALTDKVRAALNNKADIDVVDLETAIPELVGLNDGALAQVIQDSGMELIDDAPVTEEPAPE